MSLGIDPSILKIPKGSCCLSLFRGFDLGFKVFSTLKLLELNGVFIGLVTLLDFSSSIALDVLSSLTKMKRKHFMMFSDNLLGCRAWLFFSTINGLDGDFGGRSKLPSTTLSLVWKKEQKGLIASCIFKLCLNSKLVPSLLNHRCYINWVT